jgi:hypothetical protein
MALPICNSTVYGGVYSITKYTCHELPDYEQDIL